MATYVLLNQVRTTSGPIAPGTTYSDASEQVPTLLACGAVFGEIGVVGAAAVTQAEKMRRRGAAWEAIELFLLDAAGLNVADLCMAPSQIRCRRLPNPPVYVACNAVNPYGHAIPQAPRILMRGSRTPSGTLLWAGDMITGEQTDFAYRAGLEVVNPDATPTPTIALAFAEDVADARRRGDRTWEENEEIATRARFEHCAERCARRNATCPPLYFPVGVCGTSCYPYLGQAPAFDSPWRPWPRPPRPRPPFEPF